MAYQKGPVQATQEVNKVATTVVVGQKIVATPGTELPLTATSKPLKNGVWVRANTANADNVFIGLNPVTSTTGFILDAGEEVFVPIDNANKVYVDAATAADGVSFIGT